MAIVRAPLKSDAPGKASRWRVILYNPTTGRQEWTTHASKADAQAFERAQKTRLKAGTFIDRTKKRTFAQTAEMFLAERAARNRRGGTLTGYRHILNRHLLPTFGPRELSTVRRADIADHFDAMRAAGATAATVNRALRTLKALLYFALERELIERNPLQRFRPFEARTGERHVSRDAFSESEVQALMTAARPDERALVGLLCFAALRPGEAFGLDWASVDMTAGCLSVSRTWDGKAFNPPKTRSGVRTISLDPWLLAELSAHRERTGGAGLVFANAAGKPLNTSNLRRDVWLPLKRRAGVRDLDLYSLRHTAASMGRSAGQSAYAMSRLLGHAKTSLVDQVYAAHSLSSATAGVVDAITTRALGLKLQLRVIEGGKSPDVRQPLEDSVAEQTNVTASA